MNSLRITRLELTNHGPFRGTHRFELPEEPLAVLIGSNESGKTTLLESVPVILWGETDSENGRDRNWSTSASEPHRGTVDFVRVDDGAVRRIRVQRDFETHDLIAWELKEGDSQKELFRGKHNPAGRTQDNRLWPNRHLPRLWAPVTWQTFREIAMLTQPIPNEIRHDLVQQLVAGAGAGTQEQAKVALQSRFRTLSKYSRTAGPFDRDARNDGQLEKLEAQRDQLQQELDSVGGNLDQTIRLRERLNELEQQVSELTEKREDAEATLEVIDAYRRLDRKHHGATQRSRQLDETLTQADEAETQVVEAVQAIEKLPVDLRGVSQKCIQELEGELDTHRIELAKLVKPDQLLEKHSELEALYSDVKDWPGQASEHVERLQAAHEDRGRVRKQVESLREDVRAAQPQPDDQRRLLVSIVAGLAAGVVSAATIGGLSSWPVGLGAGVVLGIIGGVVAYTAYRPTKTHAGHDRLASELATATEALSKCDQEVQTTRAALTWTNETDVTRLVRLAERRDAFARQRAELDSEDTEQRRLRAKLDPSGLTDPLPRLIEACSGNANEASRCLEQAKSAQHELAAAQGKLAALLGPLEIADVESLRTKCQEANDSRVSFVTQIDQLAGSSALAESLRKMPPEQIDARNRESEKAVQDALDALEENRESQLSIRQELADIPNLSLNVADAENRVREIERKAEKVKAECRAVGLAHELLEKAGQSFSIRHSETISEQVNESMTAWTGMTGRRFVLGADFRLEMSVSDSPITETADLSALSEGTCDQLALAVRLAVLERVGADVVLPMLIDDALLTWDHDRRAHLLPALQASAQQRQIILTSHEPAFATWGTPIIHTQTNT